MGRLSHDIPSLLPPAERCGAIFSGAPSCRAAATAFRHWRAVRDGLHPVLSAEKPVRYGPGVGSPPHAGMPFFASVGQLEGQPNSTRPHAGSSPVGSARLGHSSTVERRPSKPSMRVRFPLPAPILAAGARCLGTRLVSGTPQVRSLSAAPRGHGSVGRASALHAEGRRFDPDWLHHIPACSAAAARLLWEQDVVGSIPATRTTSLHFLQIAPAVAAGTNLRGPGRRGGTARPEGRPGSLAAIRGSRPAQDPARTSPARAAGPCLSVPKSPRRNSAP